MNCSDSRRPFTIAGATLFMLGLLATRPATGQSARPGRDLSLAEATARALSSNPELRAARADTGLTLAQLVGSRLRPNPALSVEYLSNGDGRLSLTQDLQFWGLRRSRIQAASLEQERDRYTALDAVRTVRRDVVIAYRELAFQHERVALLDSLTDLNEQIARVANLALEQGIGSELDSRLSAATYQQSLLDREAATRETEIQQVQLARLLGDSLTSRYSLIDSLPTRALQFLISRPVRESVSPPLSGYDVEQAGLDSLIRIALAQRPDMRAAESDARAQEASLVAAHAAGKPTVAVGAIYGRTRDDVAAGSIPQTVTDNGFGLGVVIGLPVANRNQGEILRAQFAGTAARLRMANVRLGVERDVRVAAARVALAASRLETMRRAILPLNQGALRLARAAFSRGQVNIFQVLQVQRTYAEATTTTLSAIRDFAAALNDLEAAVGGPVQ